MLARSARTRRIATTITLSIALASTLGTTLSAIAHADGPGSATPTVTTTVPTPSPTPRPVPQPVPHSASRLPSDLEALPRYAPATSCDYTAKPGVAKFATLIQQTYPGTGTFGIVNTCSAEGSRSEHTEGRAWDWKVNATNPAQVAQVNALVSWLLAPDAAGRTAANARRVGINYIIWNKKILGLYNATGGWRNYSCSGITGCHQDHVHFSFSWNGAMGRTSFWTGQVAPADYGPCVPAGRMFAMPYRAANPTPCPVLPHLTASSLLTRKIIAYRNTIIKAGSSGPAVATLQEALGGLVADGGFGSRTTDLLKTYQARRHLPQTGIVTQGVWANLLGYVTAGTVTMPVPVAKPTAVPTASAKPVAKPTSKPVSKPVTKSSPLTPYRTLTLKPGSRGAAVTALQKALHVTPSGLYATATRTAVVTFQKAHHLVADGVVGPATWKALGA